MFGKIAAKTLEEETKRKSLISGFDPKAGLILVIGGEGVVAYRVACRLVSLGYPTVRVGVLYPNDDDEHHSSLPALQGQAEIVRFDWEDESTYQPALQDVRRVFITLPHIRGWNEHFAEFLRVAKRSGVRHFVKLSFYHALASRADTMANFVTATRKEDPFLKVPLVLMHRECDGKIIKIPRPFTYTILFASHFMSNATVYQKDNILQESKFYGASGGHGVNYVSPNDCAEVATRALLFPKDHNRVGYNLTGPCAITDNDIAQVLSDHYHKHVQYVDEPLETYAQDAKDTDWGPSLDVAYLEYVKASGIEEQLRFVSHDIDRTCGHPAEKFEEYLQHSEFMTPQERLVEI